MIELIAKSKEQERKAIFLDTASALKMNAEMVEKDFWVCWTLNRIFSDEYLNKILCFKGGTSLSKAFHLIERFSEDIDLILDWNTISNGNEIFKSSRNQQNIRNEQLLEDSKVFIANILKEIIAWSWNIHKTPSYFVHAAEPKNPSAENGPNTNWSFA